MFNPIVTCDRSFQHTHVRRRGAITVYTAVLMVIILGMVAFAVEVGTMMHGRCQMQAVADASALAGASVLSTGSENAIAMAKEYAAYHSFLGTPVTLTDDQIEVGFWDVDNRTFSVNQDGNAIRVNAKSQNVGLVFGSILGSDSFQSHASSIAMAPSRDIVFVVDLSGSMNDDSEPIWATNTINDQYADTEHATIGTQTVQQLYTDMGYGEFPGELKYIGYSLGVEEGKYAYPEMSKDNGPLADVGIPANYRILPSDDEPTRKFKTYSWIIEVEIPAVMPGVTPTPNAANFDYWERYVDYIIRSSYVHSIPWDDGGDGGDDDPPDDPQPPAVGQHQPELFNRLNPFRQVAYLAAPTTAKDDDDDDDKGSPPVDRGWLPWIKDDGQRMYHFNNPNVYAHPTGDSDTRWALRNYIGYQTYVQFMLDFGREGKPDGVNFVPISINSPHCPFHSETTAGGNFSFPPRTQPMHSVRRALINAIQVVKERNQFYGTDDQKDRVSIIAFDSLSAGTTIVQPLTNDYLQAMEACTDMQASIDEGQTTATELGLATAQNYIKPIKDGGFGRNNANKVVVLLTDGLPNDYQTDDSDIDDFMTDNEDDDFYGGGFFWLDAPLMQTKEMDGDGWQVYPVGIGFGTDYDFMDRMSRIGGTSIGGQSLRGSGNPAEYEQRLNELFQDIIEDPRVNLVK